MSYKGGTRTVQSVKDITLGGGYFRIGKSWDEMYDLGAVQGAQINFQRGTVPVTDGTPAVTIDQHVTQVACQVQTGLLEKRLEDMLKVMGMGDDLVEVSPANSAKSETEIIRLISTSQAHLKGKNLIDGSVTVYRQSLAIAKLYSMNSNTSVKINAIDYDLTGNTLTAYAVGTNGYVGKLSIIDITDPNLDWDTISWTTLNSGISVELKGLVVVDANTVFIVGEAGTLINTTDGGTTFGSVTTNVTYDLNDIISNAFASYYIVGDDGHIDHYDSATPAYTADARTQITGHDLHAIYNIGNAAVIAGVGYVGTTDNITANNFTAHTPSSAETYYDVYMETTNTLYVVGAYGAAYKSTNGGYTWSPISIGINRHLYSVDGNGAGQVVIVGGNGNVITSTNGFSTFKLPEKVNNYDLFAVAYIGNTLWLLGGDNGNIARMTQLDSDVGWAQAIIYDGSNGDTAEVVIDRVQGTVRRYKDTITTIPSPGRVKVVYQWDKPQSVIGYYGSQNTLDEYKLMFVHTRKDGNREIYKFPRAIPVSPGAYGFNPGGFNGYPAAFQILADPSQPIDRQFFTVEIEGQTIMGA